MILPTRGVRFALRKGWYTFSLLNSKIHMPKTHGTVLDWRSLLVSFVVRPPPSDQRLNTRHCFLHTVYAGNSTRKSIKFAAHRFERENYEMHAFLIRQCFPGKKIVVVLTLFVYFPMCEEYVWMSAGHLNPLTPKSDQLQISPAASPEILHHIVWRTWLFIAYSDER